LEADDRVILFDGLSVGKGKRQHMMGTKPDKRVYVADVIFLDAWHPEEEMRADMAWERKVLKRMGTYLKGSLSDEHAHPASPAGRASAYDIIKRRSADAP